MINIFESPNFNKPLLLSKAKTFLYPNNRAIGSDKIDIAKNDEIYVCCPEEECILAKCVAGQKFTNQNTQGSINNINNVVCTKTFNGVSQRKGTTNLCGKTTTYDIGFQVMFNNQATSLPLYTVCFDEGNKVTSYVSHKTYLEQSIGPSGRWTGKWDYTKDIFKTVDPNKLYEKTMQAQAMATHCPAASSWINTGPGDKFFAKGHHIPDADYGPLPQKRLTYNMLNAAPQYQKFNQGQWQHVENSLRRLGQATHYEWEIITGNYDTIECPGTNKDLYLYDPNIPNSGSDVIAIPKFFYKIINKEIVIVISNHPAMDHKEFVREVGNQLCNGGDICDQLGSLKDGDPLVWFNPSNFRCNKRDKDAGFTHACLYSQSSFK